MSNEGDDINWFGDHDPFTKLGHVRIIVVRHNPYGNWRGELKNCINIVAVSGFYLGFQCDPIEKKYNKRSVLPTYREDVETCEHKINHIFTSKPNGIYELTGEMWAWSSQSYEGEWDGDTEIRHYKIQEISFNDAIMFCEKDEGLWNELVKLRPEGETRDFYRFDDRIDIHPYMTRKQIYENHANFLSSLINSSNYTSNRTSFSDSTVDEIEACIHMMMLEIDSEKHLNKWNPIVLEIDQKVKNVLMDHRNRMDPER